MKAKDLNLGDFYNKSREVALSEFDERTISVPISARTSLKKELISVIGEERTKGIFTRYGWHCGASDAEKTKQLNWDNELELIYAGPKLHILHGYLENIEIEIVSFDTDNKHLHLNATWINSFEASQHLKERGVSTSPVCHTLCGYASGYLTSILGEKVLVKEVECRAMGHEQCKCTCKTIKDWGDDILGDLSYYQSNSMIKELDEVTEKLKVERDLLRKASIIHKELIEELLCRHGLQRVVDILHEATGLTTFIENEFNKVIVKAGNEKVNMDLLLTKSINTEFLCLENSYSLLRTPIFYDQNIKGYCCFIYVENQRPSDFDKMLLEQAALTSAIMILNENIKINTEQNIKRNFLNDILEDRLQDEELYKIAYYLGFDPSSRYWMITVKRSENIKIEKEISINEELISKIYYFLDERNINAIVSQKFDKVLILIEYSTFLKNGLEKGTFIKSLMKFCRGKFSKYHFTMGVSSIVSEFNQIPVLYKETLAALKASNKSSNVYFYEDLGIESVLFQIQDDTLINRFVEQHLGKLLKVDHELDLIKTLYTFINCGGNINQTAKELSMSISGLRYRLTKIGDILERDLNNTQEIFSLYLSLNILKAKGIIFI